MNGYFVATMEKEPMTYRCGEDMVFKLKLTDGEKPIPCDHFRWHLETDDGCVKDGRCDGASGSCEVTASISIPGFVHLQVTACDQQGEPLPDCGIFNGGAGAEIEKITRGLEEPADYDAFWARALAELDAIPPKTLQMKEIPTNKPGYRQYDVTVYCGEPDALGGTPQNRFGAPVSGYLSVPEGVDEGKRYPLELQFMGYSFVGAAVANTEGHITFQVNPHGLPNGLPSEEYSDLQEKTVGTFGFSQEQNRTPDTVYFKWMVLRNVQALRWAKQLEGWDGQTIRLSGGSMGAFQSCGVAALCPEVTHLNIDVPWMCDLGSELRGRLPGWRPPVEEDGQRMDGIRYYDTVSFISRATCPVNVNGGLGDYVCPPSGLAVLYNHIRTKKRMEWHQNRAHEFVYPPEMGRYVLQHDPQDD